MARTLKRLVLVSSLLLAAVGAFGASPADAAGASFIGTDTTTKGNWSTSTTSGRTYTYGTFASILPNATGPTEYEVGGDLTTNPNLDETGGPGFGDGGYTGEQVDYSVHGPTAPETRALLLPGGTQRRAAACYGNPVSVSLPLSAGSYRIAVYVVDYDYGGRVQTSLTGADTGSASQTVTDAGRGTYVRFKAKTNGSQPIVVTTSASAGANAVISGVFVDTIGSVSGVNADGLDTTTKGNWIGTYGSAGYLLCGAATSGQGLATPWSPSGDIASGLGAYTVSGGQYAWTPAFPSGPIVQPAYAYAWTPWVPHATGDPRYATFWEYNAATGGPPAAGDRRATTWDSGDDVTGEAGRPLVVDLSVPANSSAAKCGFNVSLYFFDYDNNRTQTLTVTDVTNSTVVDTRTLSNFGGGVYSRYFVPASTDLQLTLSATAGVNAILNGIFLDEVACPPAPVGNGTLAPTQTTCQDFTANNVATLGPLQYGVKSGKINNVAPGVFFYYSKFTAPSSSFSVNVTQAHDTSHPSNLYMFAARSLNLYDSACGTRSASGLTFSGVNGSQTAFTVTGVTPGATYVAAIKYDGSSIAGQATPNPTTVTYEYKTIIGGNTVAQDLTGVLKLKV